MNMLKRYLETKEFKAALVIYLLLCFTFISNSALSQQVGVRALVGYRVAGNAKTSSGIVMPRESINFQFVGSYELENGIILDASYLTSPSHIKFRAAPMENWQQLGEIQVSSVMVGGGFQNNEPSAAIVPFGIFRIGRMNISSLEDRFSSFGKLVFAIEGGVKLPFSHRFGLVTQINMLMPIHGGENDLFADSLGEYQFNPKNGITLVQFAINTGFYIKF